MPIKFDGGDLPEAMEAAGRKMMTLSHGLPGVGKTGFALSGPSPFWVYNLDRPLYPFIRKRFNKENPLTLEEVTIDVDVPTQGLAQQYLNRFDALAKDALASKSGGTLMVDAWDLFWDLVKIAKVPGIAEGNDLPKSYEPANAYMNNWLGRLGRSSLNVVFTTLSSRVWSGAKTETDRVKADGFKHKDRMLTHEVYLFSPEDRRQPNEVPLGGDPNKPGATGQTHRGLITLCKLNEPLINRLVPNINYGLLYKLTYGDAYPEPDRLWSPSKAALAEVSAS